MGAKDEVSKQYFSNNERFADLFNYYMFNGRQVIRPECLVDRDTEELVTEYDLEKLDGSVRRYRDLLKEAVLKEDEKTYMLLLGIENQSSIDYIMPIRNMIYDGIRYHKQVVNNRNSGKVPSYKIKPVVTLVVYLSPDKWNAPCSLYDMMDIPEELKNYVDDYRINLVSPYEMTESDFKEFATEIRNVFKFLKVSKDADEMENLAMTDDSFRNLDLDSARMLNEFTDLNFDVDGNQQREVFDKCVRQLKS